MFLIKINIKSIWFFIIGFILIQHLCPYSLFAEENQAFKSSIKIIVKETSLVKQSHIFLGDIADINANRFLKEALEKIELGFSPKPGKIKLLDKKKIVSIIQGQRYLPENIIVTSPQQIYVKRLSQKISKQEVRQFVDSRLSQVFKNQEYQLKTLNIRGLEAYPQGKTRFLFDSNEMINKNGKFSCYIDIVIDGIKEDRLRISGVVVLYEKVFYTKRSLKKGATISIDDIILKKKNIFELSENFIKTFDDIDGKILKSGIRKGDYLKTSLLSEPPMVQKGDIVTLVSRNQNLLIVTSAISKEDGFENELIKVENLDSGRLVRVIVKEKSKVEVVY
ncbi:MAG: flagellar basal body P-ring formation chaperone FlgA [Desulfobacula sp.]|uniref:flagellar basal body P-ring formation chaperone FlgA n=1 Tax=Desulfobacula sp. TaxID=2593537 RepID=UPI0025BC935B|nr:flagellar basal body P-ring formation chaperone FlgA [Desulfobacula sp.]MCD4722826.1 flagellar basal body P-ring formation chaperone FlgA [Desulfobacula sp.]